MSLSNESAQADLFDIIFAPALVGANHEAVTVGLDVPEAEAIAALADRLSIAPDAIWFAGWALLLARLAGVERVCVCRAEAPTLIEVPASGDLAPWLVGVTKAPPLPASATTGSLGGTAAPKPSPQSGWSGSDAGPARDSGPALIWSLRPGTVARSAVAVARFRGIAGTDDHDAKTGGMSGHTRGIDRATVERLGELLRTVMSTIVEPGAQLETISPLTPAERERVVLEWNRTSTLYRTESTVHGLFREEAARSPDRVALLWDGGRLTYGDLDRWSDALAERLILKGVDTDDPVALCIDRSPEAVVGALAILKAGGAYLPLDPRHPAERLAFAIRDAGARVLVTRRADMDAALNLAALTVLVEEARSDAAVPLSRAERAGPRTRAYVMYTSGSTGEPKGVQIEHRSIVRLVGSPDYVRLDAETRFLHAAPLGFDASTLEIWGPLLHGGTCVIYADPVPTGRGLAQAIATHGVTGMWLTAALFNSVVDEDPSQLRGVRQLFTGGEALSPSHIRRALDALPSTELVNGYGPTECTTFTTTYPIPHDQPRGVPIPIGRPIADTQTYVLNQAGDPVPIGIVGELYVGGLGVARGYLAHPELNAERFVTDHLGDGERLYRTGDLVRWRPDGAIDFLGRRDGQVKLRGFRIELGEIEARLGALPGVGACAVVIRDEGPAGRRLVAYVTPKTGARGDERVTLEIGAPALRAALVQTLPEFMVPSAFVVLDALPVTANGKIDRAQLPAPGHTRPDLAQPYRAPSNDREAVICGVFTELLGIDQVGALDSFFELGGNSLLALRLLARLRETGLPELSPATFFAAPTPKALARAMGGETFTGRGPHTRQAGQPRTLGTDAREPIAIIGMAGRFPGASNVEAFWANLCAGEESIRRFAPEELDPSISAAHRKDPAYVPARGVLDGVELFDAGFFGISPLEAQLLDPQHRHFLEVSWHALEHAGYVPETSPGPIGIFGGMYNATYFQKHLLPRPEVTNRLGELAVMLGNEKDYLTSRVAHRLGLTGPAVSVNTACSTSLVAAAMAMDSLRNGGCDIALAGGVAITCPPNSGYFFQDGSMASPDGHTRTFDAQAGGTVFSDGVAMVVLRRLSDAIADGDTVYAVLLGAAVNNDGSERASFTAPSPEGQAAVIAAALDAASVSARSLSYIEAHGTATPLGDPIEIEGLARAFSRDTEDRGFCAIGSLKSNVGHMVIAAGAAGLIKTALALYRRTLPPSINFTAPTPKIDFSKTPFRVQTQLSLWPRGDGPRRAGVSSFGFGGTNAHAVLEEAPEPLSSTPSTRGVEVLLVSARSAPALAQACANLKHFLLTDCGESSPTLLADIAHTLQTGRRGFSHRRYVVAGSVAQASERLMTLPPGLGGGREVGSYLPSIAFLCPGQGSQYPRMGEGLYKTEPAFREPYDECCEILEAHMGTDPRLRFFSGDPEALVPTSVTQPAIFTLEYALARMWMSFGLTPAALIGHSVGEWVCAALAEVMPLQDALRLVVERGHRMQVLDSGSMLSVKLSAGELSAYLPKGVVVAAENAPSLSVASGPTEGISHLEAELAAAGVATRRLVTSHAFHSPMMDTVIEPLAASVAAVRLAPPKIPILSTVTAQWLSDAEATDTRYWAEHLRRPVRFAPAASALLADSRRVLVEIGPRATLSALARQAVTGKRSMPPAIPTLGDAVERESETLATAIGQLWSLGANIDWAGYRRTERRRRMALPAYPFERQRYWVEAPVAKALEPLPPPPAALAPTVAALAPAPVPDARPETPSGSRGDDRRRRMIASICELVEEVSGTDVADTDPSTPWLELGLDSLTLTQLAIQVQRAHSIKVTFRQVMESLPTIESLARYLDEQLPQDTQASATRHRDAGSVPIFAPAKNEDDPAGPVGYDVKKAFGAIARIHTVADELTALQRTRLDAFITRYTARTRASKEYTARHRGHMADPRVVNGFRPLTKELTYQLVIERSRGSRMWDLDGNEYIDVLSGFGMNMFGWQPDFLREAIHLQVDKGYEIGPQHALAGEAAELFCDVTGADRAAFCNTGSEAVMGAMRIARTVTGRSLIAIFTGAYHGIFDEVIVRGTRKLRSIPAAPGIMPSASQNVLVLDYGTPESLEILRQRAHELAAIVVEPVQSRRPDFRPVEFLRELRTLTEKSGTLLIFDEVVTGFRAHPRGAQGLFNIQADLASYGKVVGGGFSIGVIAGKRAFMDALDGGHWDYGDASIPTVGVTYFAGTFVRHPLALAAACAVLKHLKEAGPALQEGLTARTAAMVEKINASMAAKGAPFKLNTFASLWRNVFTEDLPYGDLIYAMLRDRGIHILDNFPCFLTTSHSDDDIRAIVAAYEAAADEMQTSGFFPAARPMAAAAAATAKGTRQAPSTEPQREVWLAARLGPEASLAYNESVSLHLRGEVDVAALRHALRELPIRHDALRSTFAADGLSVLAGAAPQLDVPLVDLGSLLPEARELEFRAITSRHVAEPFDLESGPLVRAELVRLAPDHHVLVFTGHHIVLDGWSYWVLVKDLAALYSVATGARTATLTEAPSFLEYAANCAARADSAEVRANESWWAEQFADGGPTLDLPADRPRPPMRTTRSGRADHLLPAELVDKVRKVGAGLGASLFATLLAGFQTLLHRLTGQTDIVVGIPAAGQSAAGLEGLVGHCVNMLPLRARLTRATRFADHVKAARGKMLDAYDHQDVTFGRVLQVLPIARDPGRLPLISVVFNIDQALSRESHSLPGVAFELQSNPRQHETFELFINAVDDGSHGMRLECQYHKDLFDAGTVRRWLTAFERLLRGAVADPNQTIGELSILPEEDRRALAAWNETAADYPRNTRIEELIAITARRAPERVAVRCRGEALTYGQLWNRGASIAAGVRAAGVRAGDRVGLLVDRDLDLLPSIVGVLTAGAAYVPLDPTFPAHRLRFMVKDAAVVAIVTTRAIAATVPEVIGEIPVVALDMARAQNQANSMPVPASAGTAEADAYVIYTSGSTGQPKGVRVSHRSVVNLVTSVAREPGMTERDIALAVTTLSFDIAVSELILPLVVGATIVLADRTEAVDGDRLRALVEGEGVTFIDATPATWRLLRAAGWEGSSKITAICTGEAMPRDLAADLATCVGSLWNGYGPTETTVWSTFHRVHDASAPVLIGHPVANTTLYVFDEGLQPVPIGVVGELFIGGDGVSLGYLGRPELTAERFLLDHTRAESDARIYRTGDLVRWRVTEDGSGALECLGRTDFQVKVRGYRIELGEIEVALTSHPAIAQAAVTAREDRPGDVRLVGYIVPRAEGAPSDETLKRHLGGMLPEYMIPWRFLSLSALPLTPNGKVDRKALPARPESDRASHTTAVAPRTLTEQIVALAYQETLALPRVSVLDNFFAMGGHSLLAAQMTARLSRSMGRDVPMRKAFEHPTVADLAAWLDEDRGRGGAPLPPIPHRSSATPAPLSLMQQRVWYLEQLQSRRTVFNVPSAHRLRGALDVDALGRAFSEMVRRQEVLRTAIGSLDDAPVQIVSDDVDAAIPLEDLSSRPVDERECALARRLREEIAQPFDLTRAPLFRVRLFRLAADHHVLFFMAHHIIWDGWSFDLLYEEMAALYEAQLAGRPTDRAQPPVTYSDFAAWHREWMSGPELVRQLEFWRAKLQGAPDALDLPTDHPRPPVTSGAGSTEWVQLPPKTLAALRDVGLREGATLYMTLLGAWTALLHQFTRQTEVIVGTPVRGRNAPEVEQVMGFFVNALPLRLRIDPGATFLELLRGVRSETVEAFGAQDVPFEHLVRVLGTTRDESRFPIYQAFFSYQDARARPPRWGNLDHSRVPVFQPAAAQDLAMWFVETASGLVGGLNYSTDLLEATTAARLKARFLALVEGIAHDPDRPLRTLLEVTEEDRRAFIAWNETERPLGKDATLTALLSTLGQHGNRPAIRHLGKTVTYASLAEQRDLVATALSARGIGRGDVVALLLERTPTMLASLLGTLACGATYLPLDPAFPPSRLSFMLQDSGAKLVITDVDTKGLGIDPARVLRVEDLASVSTNTKPVPPPAVAPDDAAYLIYTSGSTGHPKGVCVPQRAVVNFLASMREQPGLAAHDRLVAVTTLSFDIAVLELLLPLTVGAVMVLATREQATNGIALRGLLEQERATIMQATPATWRLLIEAGWRGGDGFKALCGGEALPPELAVELGGRVGALWNMYGPTETTVWSTCVRVEPGASNITIGRPIGNTQAWILDEAGELLPIGVPGELYLGGDGVALGYHQRPELTAERFVADRFSGRLNSRLYRTGDLARWRSDGQLQHLGRTDFQVKLRGYRIELGEIEIALARHEQVAEAVVVAQPGPLGEQRLVAYLTARASSPPPTSLALREHLGKSLPDYMVPAVFVPLERLPLTPNGKIDRRALPAPKIQATTPSAVPFAGPRSEAEKMVAGVWHELLGVEQIELSDNFLDLGGHSLLIMQAISRLEGRTGKRLNPRAFIFQTLAQIACQYEGPAPKPPTKSRFRRFLSSLTTSSKR